MFNFMKLIQNARTSLLNTIESQENNNLQKINSTDDIFPLEYLMQIPDRMKTHKFYQDIEIGDIVIASVTCIYDNHIELVLLCTMGALVRDIHSLKIPAICKSTELPTLSNFSTTHAFRYGDNIKAIIIKVVRNESLEISMNEKSQMNQFCQTDLGMISDEKLPLYLKISRCSVNSEKYFTQIFPFTEPESTYDIQKKMEYYGMNLDRFTLLDDMRKIQISEKETAKSMRKEALIKESMKYVFQGLNYYKLKKNNEAFDCYNQALSISENNVTALVARGALHASLKEFQLAIEDLEHALRIDPSHKNAALYLSQTIAAFSKSMPESDRIKAEILVKNAIIARNEPLSKEIIEKDKVVNQVIVITDDSGSETTKNKIKTKHKSKRKKKHKNKSSKNPSKRSSSKESCREKTYVISISSSNSSKFCENPRLSSDRDEKLKRRSEKKSSCSCKCSRSRSRSSEFLKSKRKDLYDMSIRCHKKYRSRSVSIGFAKKGSKYYNDNIIHCRRKFRSRSMSFIFEEKKHNSSMNDRRQCRTSKRIPAAFRFIKRKRRHSDDEERGRSSGKHRKRRRSYKEDSHDKRRSRRHYSSSYESNSEHRTKKYRRRFSFSRSESRDRLYSSRTSEHRSSYPNRSRNSYSRVTVPHNKTNSLSDFKDIRSDSTSRLMSLLSRSSVSTYDERNDCMQTDINSGLLPMNSRYSEEDYSWQPIRNRQSFRSNDFHRSTYRPRINSRNTHCNRRSIGRGQRDVRFSPVYKSFGHKSRDYSPNEILPGFSSDKRWSGSGSSKSSRCEGRLPKKVANQNKISILNEKSKPLHVKENSKMATIETNESAISDSTVSSISHNSKESSKKCTNSKEVSDFIASMRYNIPL